VKPWTTPWRSPKPVTSVLATLHANNANQALDRIINFFPPDRHNQVWMDLSLNLKAIVAQQLVPTPDGKGRVR